MKKLKTNSWSKIQGIKYAPYIAILILSLVVAYLLGAQGQREALLKAKVVKTVPTSTPTATPSPTTAFVPKVTKEQSNSGDSCVTFTNRDTGEKRCIYRYEISSYGISNCQFEAKKNPGARPSDTCLINYQIGSLEDKIDALNNKVESLE